MLSASEEDYLSGITIAIEQILKATMPREIELPQSSHVLAQLGQRVNALIADYRIHAEFARRLSRGDLNFDTPRTAMHANHSLKSLQANLRKLTLKTQRIAEGDFSQRVNFMGEFSAAFNSMVKQLAQGQDKLEHWAFYDELTGLPNRRLFGKRLSHVLDVAKCEGHIAALLYIDLDGFKLVNDTLGHPVGDVLLKLVATRLRSRIRDSDTLARMGGDEFTVILGHLRKKAEVAKVAQDLLDALAAPFLIGADKVMIGASAGISLFPDNATDSVDLFKQADYALYAAKRNGKNQISFYTLELGCSLSERTTLESQLRGAMDRGEISVHYQPEFNLDSRRLVRFEALARWTHPTLGTIPPHKFIPVAEESGMIVCLGSYIMERACAEAVTWQTIAPYPIQVAVNVSSIQFARNTFVAEVSEILRCTGLKPKFLQIELTESVMLGGLDRSAEMMRQLRALGVEIAIDDFGTGYSSLSHLPRLPFSALKVDRSFVADLVTNPKTLAMVTSLIALGQNLGMRIIAEGIENERQLQLVEELGCNDVQGYLLGRPIPDPGAHLWMSFPNVDTCEKAFSSF